MVVRDVVAKDGVRTRREVREWDSNDIELDY